MYYGNALTDSLRSLGIAEILVSDDFAAVINVATAGAAKGATSIPCDATTVKLYDNQVLNFGAADKIAVVDGEHAIGVTSIKCDSLPVALVDADLALPWESLGAIEGDITEGGGWNENVLTALQTGDTPHEVTLTPQRVTIQVPVIAGGAKFWRLCEPSGSEDGPPEYDVDPPKKSIFLVPRREITSAGLSCSESGVWTPAAPVDSLFFPRGYITRGAVPRPRANGGKSICPVTITVLYYPTGPAGKRGWVRGDPYAKGYTTFRV